MTNSTWMKRWLVGAVFLTSLLAGCGGGSPASLAVVLNTLPKATDDAHQSVQLLANGIKKFQVELLDQNGKPLDLSKVEVTPGSQSVQTSFSVPRAGAYQVRSSAFMANGDALLGTTLKAVQLQPGDNQLVIDNLDLANLYYADNTRLMQAQSPAGLERFLSYDQPGISLQAYCFFGYLGDDSNNRMAYFSLVQRLNQSIDPSETITTRFPTIAAAVGVGTRDIQGFRLGGVVGVAGIANQISFQHQPWDVSFTADNPAGSLTPQNQTRARLVSGTFGQKGARYQITSDGQDVEGKPMITDVLVEDSMGFVSEGFGANAFLPNWLLPAQRQAINHQFGGSVERYLAATQDPLTGQGSYYYSAPYLKVINYTVKYSGTVTAQGTGGLLWMDVVYQTFDDAAINVIKDSTWSFFIMQIKGDDDKERAIMTTQVGTKLHGEYHISSLFSGDAAKNANGVLEPEYRWNMQDIQILPVAGSEWTSPASNASYYTKYKVILGGARPADLTITMDWNEQEVKAMGRFVYEGLSNVTGTLDGKPVSGTAWLEMQPVGKL